MNEEAEPLPAGLSASRRNRLVALLVLVLLIAGTQLYMGITEHGVTAVGVVSPLLTLLVATVIIVGVFRWVAKDPIRARGKWKTFALIGAGGAALSAVASVLGSSTKASPTDLPDPKFHVEGRRVFSGPLGYELTIPEPWTQLDIPAQPGADFAFRHAQSGAALGGYALVPDRANASIDATLNQVLDEKRKKWGGVDDVQWGNESISSIRARTLAFTFTVNHRPVRVKQWITKTGSYIAGFTCGGAVPTFSDSEALCRDVLTRIVSSR
jgi:hypothetical protein